MRLYNKVECPKLDEHIIVREHCPQCDYFSSFRCDGIDCKYDWPLAYKVDNFGEVNKSRVLKDMEDEIIIENHGSWKAVFSKISFEHAKKALNNPNKE